MLDTTERAGVEEVYSVAGNTSDLSVEADKRNDADVLIAAGWSPSRIGMALLRLHSEWNARAKPRRPLKEQIDALAAEMRAEDEQEKTSREKANGELARLQAVQAQAATMELAVEIMKQRRLYEMGALPLPALRPGNVQERARVRAHLWYANELRLLANGLKSRAAVWEQLTPWIAKQGIAADTAAEALLFWLDANCTRCDGLKFAKEAEAPMLSVRACSQCHGTGRKPSPLGAGKMLVHLDYCVSVARGSLKKALRNKLWKR